jgi:hypothetical protein
MVNGKWRERKETNTSTSEISTRAGSNTGFSNKPINAIPATRKMIVVVATALEEKNNNNNHR